jgi:hypothetical protein
VPGAGVGGDGGALLLTLGRTARGCHSAWRWANRATPPRGAGASALELSVFPSFVFYVNFQHWTLALLG